MSAQRTEFRVVWKREGRQRSTRIFQSWDAACRKAAGIVALEAVKDETTYDTLPDLEEPPTIEQRSVGDWETNPYYVPGPPQEGAMREMRYLYAKPEPEAEMTGSGPFGF